MADPFRIDGKRALVVGAAGGIGAATCRLFSRLGATVAAADLSAPSEMAAALEAEGVSATAFRCDVADRPAVDALLARCAPVDIIVYTAAICPFDDWTAEDWDDVFRQVIAVNLKGALDVARAGLRHMKGRGGRIVLVSSLAGRTGGLIASPHYVASKGGLNALIKWLAQRGAADGVLVNGVAPASVDTAMMSGQAVDLEKIPLGRMARPRWPARSRSSRRQRRAT